MLSIYNIGANILSFILMSPQEIAQELAQRIKAKRLEQNLSQEGLSLRSGVSLGSIKRFEQSGAISLKFLIELTIALGCSNDFSDLFVKKQPEGSLFYAKTPKQRKRGTIK